MKTLAAMALLLTALVEIAAPIARAQTEPPTPDALWAAYKQRFISAEGRLIDDSAGNVSHSEGQGYAMLLAAFAGDRATFDKLWAWTSSNLEIRGDGLAAWRWRPQDHPNVADMNNATDGDLLIAWALAQAGRVWKDPRYDAQAARIARAIALHATYPSILGAAISPGVNGFGPKDGDDGPVVNLSYWVFPAFDALARVSPEIDWARLREAGLALIDAGQFGPKRLPSDWISLKYGVQAAAAYPKRFGYDAVRIPLYLAWGAPREKARLARLIEAWAGADDAPPPVVDIPEGTPVQIFQGKGYRAVAALGRCVADGVKFPDALRSVDLESYYPSTLQMLALTALREGRWAC